MDGLIHHCLREISFDGDLGEPILPNRAAYSLRRADSVGGSSPAEGPHFQLNDGVAQLIRLLFFRLRRSPLGTLHRRILQEES